MRIQHKAMQSGEPRLDLFKDGSCDFNFGCSRSKIRENERQRIICFSLFSLYLFIFLVKYI